MMAATPRPLAFLLYLACLVELRLVTSQDPPTVYQRIYSAVEGIRPCFRLTNANSQIGCSASPSNVSGLLVHVTSQGNISDVINGRIPHDPYIVLLDSLLFTRSNVLSMKNSSYVKGIVIEYDNFATFSNGFSPAPSCPNKGFGAPGQTCPPWNPNGTDLSHTDLGDFPVFAVPANASNSFGMLVDCYNTHNTGLTGGLEDFPLCAAELQANMMAVLSTPECYRRATVITNLGAAQCDPLGDQNVWSTLFELDSSKGIIMIATKLDSTAFFPYLSFGANNELASIAVQLAVAEALGALKKKGDLVGMEKQVMFAFFQGESWDYIGSSRMVYDMNKGVFPYEADQNKLQPPLINYTNITEFLELSQVAIPPNTTQPTFYLHQTNSASSLYEALIASSAANNITLMNSSTHATPPASFQRFLRVKQDLPGIVITDYDTSFMNRFYGSRFDNIVNLLGEDTHPTPENPVVQQLTSLATSVAQALLNVSGPQYKDGVTDPAPPVANASTIADVIGCFLLNLNCSLLRTVLGPPLSSVLMGQPLSRYVTVTPSPNPETVFAFQLMAYFTGIANRTTCDSCLSSFNQSNQVFNTTWMQGPDSSDPNMCLCVKSFTHYHKAESPAFDLGKYDSTEYSTWAESKWTGIGMRIYLVTTPVEEAVVFLFGLFLSIVTLAVSCQCSRKGRLIFAASAISSIRSEPM